MLTISDEQRQYLTLDGAPLPLTDPESGACYMLMPVRFTRGKNNAVLARVPGIRAVGEADQPTHALATLAVVIQDNLDVLASW